MIFLDQVLKVVENAKKGVASLEKVVKSKEFELAVDTVFYTRGKIIISGVGKSGNVAKKIASTMASLGIKAMFLHPTEASHGDLGIISEGDTAILLSKSGTSIELEDIIRYSKSIGIPIISFIMNSESFLAKESDFPLILDNIEDGFGEISSAPMSSMTTMLTLGDAISAAVALRKNVSRNEYKIFHPGGKIGKSMTKLKYMMRSDPLQIPLVNKEANLQDVILEITQKTLGIVGVLDGNSLIGIITDGDLRRYLSKNGLKDIKALEIATKNFKYLIPNIFVDEAVEFLTQNKITSSFVLDENKSVCGVVNIHDLFKQIK